MKRYLKLLMLILTALFFVLACQDTSNSSNGTNSGIEDGGSGGDGGTGDGGGSSLDSEIINATMRVSADENDALKNTFFSPAVATNGGILKYTWNFGDDSGSVDTDYNYVTHQFNKYGKTYTVKLLLNNMSSSQQETVTMDLSLPKPELSINCNTSGALLFCNPVISQQGIQDVSYTWNIFDSTGKLEKEILSTGPSIINHRVADSGTYRIVLKGTSAQVDGEMTAERDVYISANISQGDITYNTISVDKLEYAFIFNVQSTDGSDLEYCWDFDGTARCSEGIGYQLGAQYARMEHTYEKYNASHTVTAYARIPGTNDLVSNKVIVQQSLPEVSIKAEGTGLIRKLSSVFSFIPKGNLSYIWKTGDGKEYSQETVNHTYTKNGTYTAELTVLNDLFAPEIGAVSAKPLNIYAYDNIQNVVIEYNKVNQTNQGETYTFSTPATSDKGKLYFTWKIDNAVVAEGEGLSSITHTFTKYGQNASVGLDVKVVNSSEIVSAEPVLVQTSKPTAVLNPPANVTVDIPAEFQGEVLSHLNGEDFTANLINPKYMLEISDTEYKYSDSLTIPYTFITRGTYSAKLVVTADNMEGRIVSEPVTIQANEVIVVCSTKENPADIYSAIVTCKMESVPDKNLKYTLSYKPYIQSGYTTKEYAGEEVSEIILYNRDSENSMYKYSSRDIVVNWEIYRDSYNIEYRGTYQIKFKVNEPPMGKVIDIIFPNSFSSLIYFFNVDTLEKEIFNRYYILRQHIDLYGSTYALSENGYLYSWGENSGGQRLEDLPILTPKIVSSIDGKITEIKHDNGIVYCKTENGDYYMIKNQMDYRHSVLFKLEGVTGEIIHFMSISNEHGSIFFITKEGNLYHINSSNIPSYSTSYFHTEKIVPVKIDNIGNIRKVYRYYNYVYLITNENILYKTDYYNGLEKKAENIADFVTDRKCGYDYVYVKSTDGKSYDLDGNKYVKKCQAKNNIYSLEDNVLYHEGLDAYIDYDSQCKSGIGLGLDDYTIKTKINIPEPVTDYYSYHGSFTTLAFTESGNVYEWGNGNCTPEVVPNIVVNRPIKEAEIVDYLILDNGTVFDYNTLNYITLPNNEKVSYMYASPGTSNKFIITEEKNVYMSKLGGDFKKIEHLSNIKQMIDVYGNNAIYSETSKLLFLTENGDIYAYGQNMNGVLGIGDIASTDEYAAVKVEGISGPVKFIHVLEQSLGNHDVTVYAFTEDGKIYAWGNNNGLIPIGNYFSQSTPVLIDITNYKHNTLAEEYRLISEEAYNARFTGLFYGILTEQGDVYTWGSVKNTGTNSKENVSPNGYLVKPTKVN